MTSIEITAFGMGCAIIGALIGYLVNHWLAIARDRRGEFNAIIDSVRDMILGQRIPDHIQILKIRERLPFWRREAFDRAVENYKKSKGEENRNPDGMGGFSYKDKTRIVHAIDQLLGFLKSR